MAPMGIHARLTDGQRRALTFAVLVVIAGMGMGFASSFATLYGAALAHHWTTPALLPLSVDSGIVAYVILDHLAVSLGARSRWLHLAALGLAGFTVWANAAVSVTDGAEWRVIHAAMPALWVLGVEALRFMWGHLHAAPIAADRIPAGRWLASPLATPALWRRMRRLNITSWEKMAAMEDARLAIRDRLRAACDADPGLRAPDAVARVIRTGRLPAPVLAAVGYDLEFGGTGRTEAAAEAWTDDQLTKRDQVSAVLTVRRREIAASAAEPPPVAIAASAPEATAATPSGGTPAATPVTPSRGTATKRKVVPTAVTDDALAEIVLPLFGGTEKVTRYGVIKAIKDARGGKGVSYERAGEILELAQRKHRHQRVVPIGDRKTS
jgi:hypothetical protein